MVFEPIYGHFICFSSTSLLSLYILSQGWVLRRSSRSDPPKENGRKFAPEAPVASKFRVDHGRQLLFPSVVFVRVEFSQRPNKTSAISAKFPVLSRRQRLYSNSALPKRSKVSLATRPDTQITSTPGGRQSFAPVGNQYPRTRPTQTLTCHHCSHWPMAAKLENFMRVTKATRETSIAVVLSCSWKLFFAGKFLLIHRAGSCYLGESFVLL